MQLEIHHKKNKLENIYIPIKTEKYQRLNTKTYKGIKVNKQIIYLLFLILHIYKK